MTPDEIRAAIAARPEGSIQARTAAAAYADLLDLQRRGVPSSVRAGRLLEYVDAWHELERDALAVELDAP